MFLDFLELAALPRALAAFQYKKLPFLFFHILGMFKQTLAPVQEIHIFYPRRNHCVPTWLTAPPVPPQIQIGAARIFAARDCVRNRARLAVIFGVAPIAEVVALPRRHELLFSFAPVCFVIIASIRTAPDNASIFYEDAASWMSCV